MSNPIVFFDIAGPNLKEQATFYGKVFGWEISPDAQYPAQANVIQPVSVTSPLPGTLRRDPPGTTIYLGVADIITALAKIDANGGAASSPRIEVPGVAILALFTDPAGNRMGLIEMDGDKVKIP